MGTDATWAGEMPQTYDRCLGPALFAPYAVHLAELAVTYAPTRVLELAAGTGIATRELVSRLPDAEVTATDLNPAMVSWGNDRVPEATWAVADAQSLEYGDGMFDLVLCQFGVMFFPDRQRAYAEAARVLAPGGTLLFTSWDIVEYSAFPAAMVEALRTVLPQAPPDFISRIPHGYADPDRIRSEIDSSGLREVAVERVVLQGRAPSARTLTDGFCLGTPLRFALADHGAPQALVDALADQMTARLGPGPVEGNLAAFVITARRQLAQTPNQQ